MQKYGRRKFAICLVQYNGYIHLVFVLSINLCEGKHHGVSCLNRTVYSRSFKLTSMACIVNGQAQMFSTSGNAAKLLLDETHTPQSPCVAQAKRNYMEC